MSTQRTTHGHTHSVMSSVRAFVSSKEEGEPFAVRELLTLGPRASIDQALTRLVKEGSLERAARGVYVRPKVNKIVNRSVPPSVERVVAASARAAGEKVSIHGAEAARRFGLTTQVPMRQVFATTGPSRRMRVGGQQVVLKHVAPRYMEMSSTRAGEALSALLYLVRGEVTPAVARRVCAQLPQEEVQRLRENVACMPAWLSDTMRHVPEFATAA